MSEYRIQISRAEPQVRELQSCAKELSITASEVRSIVRNLSIRSDSRPILEVKLINIAEEIDNRSRSTNQISMALSSVIKMYDQADKGGEESGDGQGDGLVDGRNGSSASVSDSKQREKKDSEKDGWWDSFADHFLNDFLSNLVEQGGKLIVTFSGYYNYIHAYVHGPAGPNSFVIVNPAIAEKTLKYAGAGKWVSAAGKYGLPVIGGVIEYILYRHDGKDVKESLIKSGAHTGIGFASGAAGGAIGAKAGAAIGSVIPGAGTAAGAAIGFVAGVVIATAGDAAFDYIYDNWDTITDHVRDAGETIVSVGREISEGVESAWNTIVDFNNAIGTSIGTALGW
jgi:hypothetical protein